MAERAGAKRQAVAALLFEARRKKRLTQRQVGELIGVDPSALSRWERGEALPTAANVSRLASTYDLGELELLRRVNEAKDEEIGTLRKDTSELATRLVEAIDNFEAMAGEMRTLFGQIQKFMADQGRNRIP